LRPNSALHASLHQDGLEGLSVLFDVTPFGLCFSELLSIEQDVVNGFVWVAVFTHSSSFGGRWHDQINHAIKNPNTQTTIPVNINAQLTTWKNSSITFSFLL
jgi:hypothetical protein